ncbi:MAG: 3-hydroxyacyl-CoA dehydrogenase NAD-binding domain-containing protein [Acidobacteriota bacterium]|nr:3-hydroxyacyl-CoA dehydrogenase NAD-binding domain-containing protein [Acidobacteriota bacterium]
MPSNFRLDVESSGLATLVFDTPGKSANVFTREAMDELAALLPELAADTSIKCLVLLSAKPRIFIAGADIEGIAGVTDRAEAEKAARMGQEIFAAWAELPFPTVAAVNGTCAGGGTELSLASDLLLISDRPDLRIGLPETKLGIVPGWGGCTRLPRKIGLAAALDLILGGKMVRPRKAFKLGLADALLPDATFLAEVRRMAEKAIANGSRRQARSDLKSLLLEKNPVGRKIVFDQARKQVMKRTKGQYPAPPRAIEVIKAGIDHGMSAGFDAEARAIGELAVSPVSKNLIHLFQLMEAAKGVRTDGDEDRAVEIRSAAVLGAGVMGGGIAQIIADKADIPVRLKDIDPDALARGTEHAAGIFRHQLKRRWITRPEADRKMNLIRPCLDYSGFGSADLVVEAIVENLEIKQKVFAELAAEVGPHTLLATNTSSLSIDAIARDVVNPGRVVGMHFFNPVDKMPLVEVIAGARTDAVAVDGIVAFSRRLGKTPVVVKDGPGFLVNRLLAFTLAEAMWLLDEGQEIEALDRAATAWGLPVGPAALTDEVGIDVAVKVAHIMSEAFPDRLAYPQWMVRLPEDGRLGAKVGKGIYRYKDGKRTSADPATYELIGRRRADESTRPEKMLDRLLLPMVNEAARCLEERVVATAGQLDLAMIMGTGFPPFRGGLCRWADSQGLSELKLSMERLAARLGARFAPSAAFERVVAAGGFYRSFS